MYLGLLRTYGQDLRVEWLATSKIDEQASALPALNVLTLVRFQSPIG